ncbi:MAG: helix-turn-helix domain-containing protein [Nanoarchaeota archaeon]
MNTSILREIGLTDNEITIYIHLLKAGSSTAYQIGKETGIYRVHVYDKIEQLMDKGMVSAIHQGSKKYFEATPPEKINDYMEEKRMDLEQKYNSLKALLPELQALAKLPKEETEVTVFRGREGIKNILRDVIKSGKDVCIMGIDDQKYNELLPAFMPQYFRDLTHNKQHERIINIKKKEVFQFNPEITPNTSYRYLGEEQFNPTNTFIYARKVVIVTWAEPIYAVMIRNGSIAASYQEHFEHLWNAASQENTP